MIFSVEEARNEILKEIVQVYVKCIFLENYYSNLLVYTNSSYNNLVVDFYFNKVTRKIGEQNLRKISSFMQQDVFEQVSKKAIEEIIEIVADSFNNTEKYEKMFLDSIDLFECPVTLNSTLDFSKKFYDAIHDSPYVFHLEYYLRIKENAHNQSSTIYKDVVNISRFISTISNGEPANLMTYYDDVRFGLRLMYKQKTNNGPTDSLTLREKCFSLKRDNKYTLCTVPIASVESENIANNSLLVFKENIEYDKPPEEQKYIKLLKESLLNSDDYSKKFLKAFPIDAISVLIASKFNLTSKLFDKVLKENSVYVNSSESVMKTIDSLINYKEITL